MTPYIFKLSTLYTKTEIENNKALEKVAKLMEIILSETKENML